MEIIEINTYTQNEKLHIAKEHLIEKQMKANGIKAKQLTISDKAIEDIILYYTRESRPWPGTLSGRYLPKDSTHDPAGRQEECQSDREELGTFPWHEEI